jgi:UDP-N-acetylmuramate--alanine ligase
MHNGVNLGRIALLVPGRHNVLNALAATVVGIQLGLSVEQMAAGFIHFNGAKRRFQTKGRFDGIWIVDDYAHHPTEIRTTLIAAKQTKPNRVICAFQPHRYTRTKLLLNDYGSCFKEADILVLTDIYSAGETPIAGINGETIKNEVEKQTGKEVIYIPKRSDIALYLRSIAKSGDLILSMGAGDIYRTGEELVELLNEK